MPLVIRKEQFAELQLESDIRWYETQLAELYAPFAAMAVGQRRQGIREGIHRATALGVNRPEWLQFLCFEHTFSPGCLEDPAFDWARQLLEEPGRSSSERVKRLRQESIRRLLDAEAREQRALESSEAEAEEEADGAEPENARREDAAQ